MKFLMDEYGDVLVEVICGTTALVTSGVVFRVLSQIFEKAMVLIL